MTKAERLAEAEEMRGLWIEAMKAVSKSQSYNIGGQSLTRANLSEILNMIKYWDEIIAGLCGGRRRISQVIPTD
jgi:hypothetical protein